MTSKIDFQEKLNLSPADLGQFLDDFKAIRLNFDEKLNIDFEYLKGLYFYLTGQSKKLNELIMHLEFHFIDGSMFANSVLQLLKVRYLMQIQDTDLLKPELEHLKKCGFKKKYLAEKYTVMARAYEVLRQTEWASRYYAKAALFFKAMNLSDKALRASFNCLVCRNDFELSVKLQKSQSVFAEAIKNRDRVLMAVLLNNFASCLLYLGAYHSAEKLIRRALRIYKAGPDTQNYKVIQLNLAHYFYLTKQWKNLFLLCNELIHAVYPEVQLIAQYFLNPSLDRQHLQMTLEWGWRMDHKMLSMSKLSNLEDLLLGLIILRPRVKQEIFACLWPGGVETEVCEIRFKRTLARLRKKRMGVIQYHNRLYQMNFAAIYNEVPLRDDIVVPVAPSRLRALSKNEKKVQRILMKQPLSFYDLLEKMYWHSKKDLQKLKTENTTTAKLTHRLKNLIARIRQKQPERLQMKAGKYHWL